MKKIIALLALLVAVPALAQSAAKVATCPTATDGAQFGTAWLPCASPAVFVAQPVPANAIVASKRANVNVWRLASNTVATDLIATDTPAATWQPRSSLTFAAPVVVPPPPAFTGSATLSWTAPTLNTDGTPLTDLASYNIYQDSVKIGSVPAATTSYVVNGLVPGSYVFSITAVNALAKESDKAQAPLFTVDQQVIPKTPSAPGTITVKVTVTVP